MTSVLLPPEWTAHPVTGAALEELARRPRRRFALFDKREPCDRHSDGLTRAGLVRCGLCGATWDGTGRYCGVTDREQLPPHKPAGRPAARRNRSKNMALARAIPCLASIST